MLQSLLDLPARTVLAPGSPGAGNGASIPVPGSERQQLVAVAFRLVTSAVVANRTPRVTVQDGTGVILAASVSGVVQAASLTTDYAFAFGVSASAGAAGAVVSGPLPPILVEDQDTITIDVAAIDGGDVISRVRVTLLQSPVRDDE